jgi:hypothetical protein
MFSRSIGYEIAGAIRSLRDIGCSIRHPNNRPTRCRAKGDGSDDPTASYAGSLLDASNEQLIRQDRLGSVMLMSTDRTTYAVNVNTYDGSAAERA